MFHNETLVPNLTILNRENGTFYFPCVSLLHRGPRMKFTFIFAYTLLFSLNAFSQNCPEGFPRKWFSNKAANEFICVSSDAAHAIHMDGTPVVPKFDRDGDPDPYTQALGLAWKGTPGRARGPNPVESVKEDAALSKFCKDKSFSQGKGKEICAEVKEKGNISKADREICKSIWTSKPQAQAKQICSSIGGPLAEGIDRESLTTELIARGNLKLQAIVAEEKSKAKEPVARPDIKPPANPPLAPANIFDPTRSGN